MQNYLSSVKRFIAFIVMFAVLSQSVSASIWYVDTNADTDPNTCTADEAVNNDNCTFRDAVSQLAAGDTIRFVEDTTITNTNSADTNPYSISQNTVTIDGQTGGYTAQIDGGALGDGSSYSLIKASGTSFTLKGLYIYNYVGNLVELTSTASSANINNNVLGLNPAGGGTGASQAALKTSASNVTIQNNVLSNSDKGIFITAGTYADTSITGNRIGVDGVLSAGVLQSSGGVTDKGNTGQGIDVQGGNFTGDGTGVEGLTIGGPDAADRNIISGNNAQGIYVRNTLSTSGNITIQNNYIGVGSDGSTQIANGPSSSSAAGILADDHANLATVAWTVKNNVISGNSGVGGGAASGVKIQSGASATLQGNFIGLKADGTTALANTGAGIEVDAGTVTIGTNNDGTTDNLEGNVIGNNTGDGITVTGAETTTVNINGNNIGFNSSGTGSHGNGNNGITINGSAITTVNIGTVTATDVGYGRNNIGNNGSHGVAITTTGGTSGTPATVTIANNDIGFDITNNFSNVMSGINLESTAGVQNVVIGTNGDGTNDASEENVIGKNNTGGVNNSRGEIALISGVKTLTVAGNVITGGTSGSHGVVVNATDANLSSVTIGGDDCSTNATATSNSSNERNHFPGLKGDAVSIRDVGTASPVTADVTIQCNTFGYMANNTANANSQNGINIMEADQIVIKDNTISNSTLSGATITGGSKLEVYGNKFGTTKDGRSPGGNTTYDLHVAASTLAAVPVTAPVPVIIGGATAALGNVFAAAASTTASLYIATLAANTTPVTIQGNYVGVCAEPSGKGTIYTDNLATCTNTGDGIRADQGDITIGGSTGNTIATDGLLGTGNVISNNTLSGINFRSNTSAGTITGNIIGLIKASIDADYATAAGNGLDLVSDGIKINSTAITSLTVGAYSGTVSALRNVISSNAGAGLNVADTAASATLTVRNNYFGTDWAGSADRGNTGDGINIADGSTVNIGGTSDNLGNLSSGNTGDGLEFTGSTTSTINIYKNLIGLNAAGTAALANGGVGIKLGNNNATVNVGDAASTGRNWISGNGSYGIRVTGGNVNVKDNYVGLATDGTTSIPNGTNELYAESVSGSISALAISSSNRFNNRTHLAVYLKDIIPSNESTFDTDNSWATLLAGLSATYGYWQRYVGTTLTASGPQACYDGANNDGDTYSDYPGDIGCTSVQDNDEYNDWGGGFVYASTSGSSDSTTTADSGGAGTTADTTATSDGGTDTSDTAEDVIEIDTEATDADSEEVIEKPVVVAETPADTRENVRTYIIREKLSEAVNTTTDTVLDRERVNIDLLLNGDSTNVPASGGGFASAIDIPKTSEQEFIADVIDTVSGGGTFSNNEEKKVGIVVTAVVGKVVQEIFEKAEEGGGSALVLSVNKANGKKVQIDKNTKFKFVMDHKKAADEQDVADAGDENEVIITPSTILGPGRVSTMLQIMEGGDVGDPLAADKVYFRGVKGISGKVASLDELKPEKPMITNLSDDMEIAPQAVLWLAGPKVNQKLSVFAVDKIDSEDPNDWKIYEFGDYTVDEAYKVVATVDFSDKMSGDIKKFDIVIQDEDGNGSIQEITVNKAKELKLDSVLLRDGKQVIPADLTHDKSDFTKTLRTTVLLAAESAKQADRNPDGDGLMILSGYSEPGSIVFVTWESIILSSVVIADASQGYFEVEVPEELTKGEHKVLTYSYNNKKKVVSNFAKVLFSKYL